MFINKSHQINVLFKCICITLRDVCSAFVKVQLETDFSTVFGTEGQGDPIDLKRCNGHSKQTEKLVAVVLQFVKQVFKNCSMNSQVVYWTNCRSLFVAKFLDNNNQIHSSQHVQLYAHTMSLPHAKNTMKRCPTQVHADLHSRKNACSDYLIINY